MSATTLPVVTAGLRPDLFTEVGTRSLRRIVLVVGLSVLVIAGFAFRTTGLSSEGLSDDELNKLAAVNDYRANGLSGANGEHPLLMKAILTVSVIAAEKWNATSIVAARPEMDVPVESALRLPIALFGALTAVLIFLVASELFGTEVGCIAAALWAFDPLVIGFNRIAKEDTLLVFFFLLANVFWLRAQRVAESQPQRDPAIFYWATAASFGAMMASKYLPVMISISLAYYYAFQGIHRTRWRLGKKKFLMFFVVMGLVFLACNPTIVLPETWRAILKFGGYQMIGHDSYEFMGRLYPHRFSDWFRGQPWYFYFVLIGVKLPVVTLLGFGLGLGLLFWRKMGDGRYFLIFWLCIWALAFMFGGGKFTRYATSVMPAVIMTAALGVQFAARKLGRFCEKIFNSKGVRVYARAALTSLVIIATFWSAASATPHYRLYLNAIGGGSAQAGSYFPQDEFYDAYMRDAVTEIARTARPGARVASELPFLAAYYAGRANRRDLSCVELADPAVVRELTVGDFVIDARGRTYFSNREMLARLRKASQPSSSLVVGTTPAADVYVLDLNSLAALRGQ